MGSGDELFLRSLELEFYFGVHKHQDNPLVSAETVGHSSRYTILYIHFRLGPPSIQSALTGVAPIALPSRCCCRLLRSASGKVIMRMALEY